MASLKLNSVQLAVLRYAAKSGITHLMCDASTGKALVNRKFATQYRTIRGRRAYFATRAGLIRAKFAADVKVIRDGHNCDDSLMKDVE